MRWTLRSPSPPLCSGRKRLQFASVSAPCFGVARIKPLIRPPRPRRATDAVPGSVSTGLQPGGYASAPPELRATFQPAGGDAGCSHANGPEGRRGLDSPPPARPTISTTAPVTATRPTIARLRLGISDVPVAVARSAVVVAVVVAAVVLGNGVGRRRWWGRRLDLRLWLHQVARGGHREPGATERRQILALGVAGLRVLYEEVERVTVVGRLRPAVGPRDGSHQRGLRPSADRGLAARPERRPGLGARSDACVPARRVLEQVEGAAPRVDENLAEPAVIRDTDRRRLSVHPLWRSRFRSRAAAAAATAGEEERRQQYERGVGEEEDGSAASHARSFGWRTDPLSGSVRTGLCLLYARARALCRLHRQQPTSTQTSPSPDIPARPQDRPSLLGSGRASALFGTVARCYSASRGSFGSVVSGGGGGGFVSRSSSGSAGEAVTPYWRIRATTSWSSRPGSFCLLSLSARSDFLARRRPPARAALRSARSAASRSLAAARSASSRSFSSSRRRRSSSFWRSLASRSSWRSAFASSRRALRPPRFFAALRSARSAASRSLAAARSASSRAFSSSRRRCSSSFCRCLASRSSWRRAFASSRRALRPPRFFAALRSARSAASRSLAAARSASSRAFSSSRR